MWRVANGRYALRSWLVYPVYIVVALLVMTPLLGQGYILTLDMVFTPVLRMPATVTSSYLFHALLHALNFAVPADVIQKMILLAIFVLSGAGTHRLIQSLHETSDKYQEIGAYFAGILYMINPFTYDRFMAGQYSVLLGYALLPWFMRALLGVVQWRTWQRLAVTTIWAVAISIISIHTVGMMALLTFVTVSVATWRNRQNTVWLRKMAQLASVGIVVFLIASSYWMVPLVAGGSSTAETISSFTTADQHAFATLGNSSLDKVGYILRLQGFWAEGTDLFDLPQDDIPMWGALTLMIWALVTAGGISYWRARQRYTVAIFGASGIAATILAAGVFTDWLSVHVPLFAGYREPQKFAAVTALCLVVFAAQGTVAVLRYSREQGNKLFLGLAATMLFLLPIVWAPSMVWGFNQQLAPVQYPADWFTMNKRLDADHTNFQTLFLPWHLYMYFGFAGKIIASPAPDFFDKPMLVSDNPEYKGAALSNSTAAKRQLDRLLPNASKETALGKKLAPLNVKYILLAKDNDYQNYEYLSKQTDLRLVVQTATLKLYRNEAWGK